MNDLGTGDRYPALSTIVVVIKIFAALVIVAGVIAVLLACTSGGYGIASGIGMLIGVGVAFVIMWAAAESIAVIIDIESNTRATALAAMRGPQEPTMAPISMGAHDRLPDDRLAPLGTRSR